MAQPQNNEHKRSNKNKFCINDQTDLLVEILKRLDGDSLGVAACVCRQWRALIRNDSLWEHTCFCHVSPPPSGVGPVVVALGGYRTMYMVYVRPVVSQRRGRVWTREEVELWLSLFCVEYYERSLGGGGGAYRSPSLMFMYKVVKSMYV